MLKGNLRHKPSELAGLLTRRSGLLPFQRNSAKDLGKECEVNLSCLNNDLPRIYQENASYARARRSTRDLG